MSGALFAVQSVIGAGVALLTGDSYSSQFTNDSQWGIFTEDGSPVLIGDTVVSLDIRNERRLANFPIEEGGFATYNKVNMPFESRVSIAKGGTESERSDFIGTLEQLVNDLELYAVVTPEYTYPSANLFAYDIRRTVRNGVTLITAEVSIEEVRIINAAQYSNNAQDSSGAAQENGGSVQSEPATAATETSVNRYSQNTWVDNTRVGLGTVGTGQSSPASYTLQNTDTSGGTRVSLGETISSPATRFAQVGNTQINLGN